MFLRVSNYAVLSDKCPCQVSEINKPRAGMIKSDKVHRIVVYGRTTDEHLKNLELVLGRMKGAGHKLKPVKGKFFRSEVNFLGDTILHKGIKIHRCYVISSMLRYFEYATSLSVPSQWPGWPKHAPEQEVTSLHNLLERDSSLRHPQIVHYYVQILWQGTGVVRLSERHPYNSGRRHILVTQTGTSQWVIKLARKVFQIPWGGGRHKPSSSELLVY